MNAWQTTPAHQTHQLGERGLVIDVRTPAEYRQCHLPGSVNAPLDSLDNARLASLARQFKLNPGDPVFLMCQGGNRAKRAAEALNAQSPYALSVIEGGLNACQTAGVELKTGTSRVWALERQVRFTAGLLVFIGVLLGYAVHPGLFGLAGFVGAGLMFAAITDWCGMGLLLAKMPWNRA
jgi:rhodanese-related sulfurtransferase